MESPDAQLGTKESYESLRVIARRMLSRRRKSSLLHTTSLAHETWIKLLRRHPDRPQSPPHFGTVVRIMRSVIIDEARNEGAAKRGKGWRRIPLSEAGGDGAAPGLDVLDIEEALLALERSHPRAARVLELRVFGGLGTAQTAALLRLSDRTVESELRFARAMLRVRLDPLSNRS